MNSLLPILGSLRFHVLCLILVSAAAAQAFIAIWAATSRVYWFWRALAVWCAVMALVPIRAYEPALTFAISSPLTILLIKLRQRTVNSSEAVKSSDARSEQATSSARYLHFTIRDLLLATVVIGMTLAGLLHI